MAVVRRLLPSIPTPTIPKRTRSLAATGGVDANSGSEFRRMAFAASVAPAAPAAACKNSRRENRCFFMNMISLRHCLRPILSLQLCTARAALEQTLGSPRASRSLPRYFVRELNSRGRTTDRHVELSSVHRPVMILDVVVSEGPVIERERNMLGFARIQLRLRESFQFLHGPGNNGMRFAHVHFGNFGAGTMAGVSHIEADCNGLISRNGGRSH